MNTIRIRQSHFLLLSATVILVIFIAYREITKHSEKKIIMEQKQAVKFNQSLSRMLVDSLSENWNFHPKFMNDEISTSKAAKPTEPIIPHIFHQVWDTNLVPQRYGEWMMSWKSIHPEWEHWFWTLDDVRELVAKHYPDHLVLYDSYPGAIFRADVMRYFVLHHFGGIYVDLDMNAILPLDDWTFHYECVVSEECYEHTYVIRELPSPNILNGFIACQPNHPFLKRAIDSLLESSRHDFGDWLYSTGPFFLNGVLEKYKISPPDGKAVTVVPPRYFFPTYDKSESDTIAGRCYPSKIRSLPPKGQLVCRELMVRSFKNEVGPFAYTDHHWVHAYMFDRTWKEANVEYVFQMVPDMRSPLTKF